MSDRFHTTVRDELRIIPEPPKTIRGKLKALLCRWFGHSMEKVGSRATTWVTVVELNRCKRCGEELVQEMLYWY